MTDDMITDEVEIAELADGIYYLNCISLEGREVITKFMKVH